VGIPRQGDGELSSEAKRALLARLLRERAQQAPTGAPLSRGQRALWFLRQLAPDSAAYHEAFAWRVRGDLDLTTLQNINQVLVQRHPILRTTYKDSARGPVQQVQKTGSLPLEITDASSWDSAQLRQRLMAEAHRPFNLETGPVARLHVFRRSRHESVLVATVHHIAVDLWSLVVMMQEIQALYLTIRAGLPPNLPPTPAQYADFVRWQTELLASPKGEQLAAYWHNQLRGELPILDLPIDRPRPAVQTDRGAAQSFRIPEETTRRLKTLATEERTTLFATLLAAFQVLLGRYTGQDDILVASLMAGRSRPEFEGIVGLFTNPVALRADLSGDPPFRTFLGQVRQTVLGALAHHDYPFSLLVERLLPKRDPSRSPLCDVAFILQKPHRHGSEWEHQGEVGLYGAATEQDKGARLALGAAQIEFLPLEHGIARLDLELEMVESAGAIFGSLRYNTDLFEAATITRMVGHFQTLLAGIAMDPEQRLLELPLLTAAERRQLLADARTADRPAGPTCIHHMFEEQVARTPEAIALVLGDERWTYRELNERANQLAHLLRAYGVGPEVLVGLCAERSLAMIVGLLGILKAGGAYLPLDPEYPPERLTFMVKDSRVPLLLIQPHLCDRIPSPAAKVICLDPGAAELTRESTANLLSGVQAHNPAYVIYTSGSTGLPKGVVIEHRGLCNLARAQVEAFEVRLDSRVLQSASFSFDASVSEVFMALTAGAALHLAPPGSQLFGPEFIQLLRTQQITTLTIPPSVLAALPCADLPDLRTLIVAGEACSAELVARWAPGRRFCNAYGPTEATVCATIAVCTDGSRKPSIGRAIANAHVCLLDARQQPVPIAVVGELYVGGIGVARGYLHRPQLTAERFIRHPFSTEPGARLYRTGDLARYRSDGTIEFLGRKDQQVKVRGFRIELGEIEAVLGRHPGVKEVVVVARTGAGGDRNLVAYLTASQTQVPDPNELRRFLRGSLPEYMVPPLFIVLDALTRLPNGKLDRQALPAPADSRPAEAGAVVPPRDDLERALIPIWEEILGVRPIGVRDDFFQMGGHSLSAVRLAALIHDRLGLNVRLASLFQGATVEQVADRIRPGNEHRPRSALVPLQPTGSEPPLFFVHPTGGTVACYAELSRQLGHGQPFHALQSPGLEGEQEPYSTIEAMAEHYVTCIRQVQPEGPYRLGGWSLGGAVALEMAQQLGSQGQTVELLAVLDASFLDDGGAVPSLNGFAGLGLFLQDFAARFGQSLPLQDQDLDRLVQSGDPLMAVEQLIAGTGLASLPLPMDQLRPLWTVFRANLEALARYRPRPYTGRVVLFRPQEHQTAVFPDSLARWRELAAPGLAVHTVPGNHYTMLQRPHVTQLAQRLHDCLAALQAGAATRSSPRITP
jgi:amino acid adenylation domain-containing protein